MAPEIAIVGGGPAGLALAALFEKKGIDYIVYERTKEDAPHYGGCLDLHPGSGQRVMKEAGIFDEFKKNSRDGGATIHVIYDHDGNKVFSWGEGRDAPEIDRWRLRKVLLTALPNGRVIWSKAVAGAERDEAGQVVLSFTDGSTASGFKLVVGADGTFSKIRPLVTAAQPRFAGQIFISTLIYPNNPFYEKIQSLCGVGSMLIMGKGSYLFNSMQGDGHYRIDMGIEEPADFPTSGVLDLSNHDAAKEFFLQDRYYGSYAPIFREMIRSSEGPFRPWLMYYFPTEELCWPSAPGVTLIGDAAHVTPPFVGEGVNCAMRDSIILANKLQEFGVTQKAVEEYEKEMFPHAIDVITRSRKSGTLIFEQDAPTNFVETMKSGTLIGVSDDY